MCFLQVKKADITSLKVDAIVNSANSLLIPGSGVCGSIHRAAGPWLAQECQLIIRRIQECPVGDAVLTPGYRLPAKFIIHAVGPLWDGVIPESRIF